MYAQGAKNAITAGFDGVEIHGGCLPWFAKYVVNGKG
jgi:hypothetical protein